MMMKTLIAGAALAASVWLAPVAYALSPACCAVDGCTGMPRCGYTVPGGDDSDSQAITDGMNGAQTNQPGTPVAGADPGTMGGLFPKYEGTNPSVPIIPVIPQSPPPPNNVPYDRPGGIPLVPTG